MGELKNIDFEIVLRDLKKSVQNVVVIWVY